MYAGQSLERPDSGQVERCRGRGRVRHREMFFYVPPYTFYSHTRARPRGRSPLPVFPQSRKHSPAGFLAQAGSRSPYRTGTLPAVPHMAAALLSGTAYGRCCRLGYHPDISDHRPAHVVLGDAPV